MEAVLHWRRLKTTSFFFFSLLTWSVFTKKKSSNPPLFYLIYSAPVKIPHQLKLEDCEIVWVKFIFSETLWVWTSQIGCYIKRKQSQKNTNKNKMSDKRRRRRKASDDSSGEEDEASITAVSFLNFFICFFLAFFPSTCIVQSFESSK